MLQPRKNPVMFYSVFIRPMVRDDLLYLLEVEKKVYTKNHRQGKSLLTHIKTKNGLAYSLVVTGADPLTHNKRILGYLAAIDDKMDNGRKCVYLDDFALIPEAQRQGIGWKLMRSFVAILKKRRKATGRPVLLDMHMTETNQRFMAKHASQLKRLGVTIVEEDTYPEYYAKEHHALYRVYRIN